jgi:hypothetical protein
VAYGGMDAKIGLKKRETKKKLCPRSNAAFVRHRFTVVVTPLRHHLHLFVARILRFIRCIERWLAFGIHPVVVHPAVSSVQQTTGTCSSSFLRAWVVWYSSSTSHFLAFYDLSSHPSTWMMVYLRLLYVLLEVCCFLSSVSVCVLSLIKRATNVFVSFFSGRDGEKFLLLYRSSILGYCIRLGYDPVFFFVCLARSEFRFWCFGVGFWIWWS